MKTAILYDSATGNTAYLAAELAKALPCAPAGRVGEVDVSAAQRVYLGFWTDKGRCSDQLKAVLPALAGKEVFLFGTAGFGASSAYFSQIIGRVAALLPADCALVGWYMCAGRMSEGVRRRYEAMLSNPAQAEKAKELPANFDAVSSHPNEEDARALVKRALG